MDSQSYKIFYQNFNDFTKNLQKPDIKAQCQRERVLIHKLRPFNRDSITPKKAHNSVKLESGKPKE